MKLSRQNNIKQVTMKISKQLRDAILYASACLAMTIQTANLPCILIIIYLYNWNDSRHPKSIEIKNMAVTHKNPEEIVEETWKRSK